MYFAALPLDPFIILLKTNSEDRGHILPLIGEICSYTTNGGRVKNRVHTSMYQSVINVFLSLFTSLENRLIPWDLPTVINNFLDTALLCLNPSTPTLSKGQNHQVWSR